MFVEENRDGLKYFHFSHIEAPHLFSSRVGGVSEGALASLNLGYTVGDSAARVDENRRRLASVLGFEQLPWLLSMNHGVEVAHIDSPVPSEPRRVADSCITQTVGVPLSITVADCVPILMYEPKVRAVAAVHAGWRGTVKGIVARTVERLGELFGAEPGEIRVGIGPSIGPESFEVGAEVLKEFLRAFPEGGVTRPHPDPERARAGQGFVDLWEANRLMAKRAGVSDQRVAIACRCTVREPGLFFSHRRDAGKTGRLLAAIGVPR